MSSVPALAEPPAFWELAPTPRADPPARTWNPRLLRGGIADATAPGEETKPRPLSPEQIRARFDLLADELALAGAGVSATRRLRRHPAYVGILSLGEPAIPLLLERLHRMGSRPIWLSLLGSLTSFQPGAGQQTVEDAAAHWVAWGKRHGRVR